MEHYAPIFLFLNLFFMEIIILFFIFKFIFYGNYYSFFIFTYFKILFANFHSLLKNHNFLFQAGFCKLG